jgi:hypothetical protein
LSKCHFCFVFRFKFQLKRLAQEEPFWGAKRLIDHVHANLVAGLSNRPPGAVIMVCGLQNLWDAFLSISGAQEAVKAHSVRISEGPGFCQPTGGQAAHAHIQARESPERIRQKIRQLDRSRLEDGDLF